MNSKFYKGKKSFKILIIVLLAIYSFQVYNVLHFPSEIDVIEGESREITLSFPFTINVSKDENKVIAIDNNVSTENLGLSLKNSYKFNTLKQGMAELELKLFGFIPVKDVKVNVIDNIHLIPGGNAVGVRLNTRGVLVVALKDVTNTDGKKSNPAKEAGIKIGDSIIDINGKKVKDADHVIELLNEIKNEKVSITIERNNSKFVTEVKPVKSMEDNCYRLGIWVRDKTAGIGTLTFFDTNTKKFGALGHGITDIDTGHLLTVAEGEIMQAKVSSIEQGKKGNPGEIRGIFFESENKLGKIEDNTAYGIYGTMYDNIRFNDLQKPLPIALQHEIMPGKAHILTTIDDNKIEKFEIEVVKTENQRVQDQKSMVIKVTDSRLLEKTGGIVQGMSGSPIIQNNKIIGAVTHVFVNDPTRGYGLYIEWMIQQAGIPLKNKDEFAQVN